MRGNLIKQKREPDEDVVFQKTVFCQKAEARIYQRLIMN